MWYLICYKVLACVMCSIFVIRYPKIKVRNNFRVSDILNSFLNLFVPFIRQGLTCVSKRQWSELHFIASVRVINISLKLGYESNTSCPTILFIPMKDFCYTSLHSNLTLVKHYSNTGASV